MKRLCRNCGRSIQERPDNVRYCSGICWAESKQRMRIINKENNPWVIYWKYKLVKMRRGNVCIEDQKEMEIYKVCDHRFTSDRFISNKTI